MLPKKYEPIPSILPALQILEGAKDRMVKAEGNRTRSLLSEMNRRRSTQVQLMNQAFNFDTTKLRPGTAPIFADYQRTHVAATDNFMADQATNMQAVKDIRAMFQLLQMPDDYQDAYDDMTAYTDETKISLANGQLENEYKSINRDKLGQVIERGAAIYNGGYWDNNRVAHNGGRIGQPPQIFSYHMSVNAEGQLVPDENPMLLYEMPEWNSTTQFEITPAIEDSYGPSVTDLAKRFDDRVRQNRNSWNHDLAYDIVWGVASTSGGERESTQRAIRRRAFFDNVFPKIRNQGQEYVASYLDAYLDWDQTEVTNEDGTTAMKFTSEILDQQQDQAMNALKQTTEAITQQTKFPTITRGGSGRRPTQRESTNYYEQAVQNRRIVREQQFIEMFPDTEVETPMVVGYTNEFLMQGENIDLGTVPNPDYEKYTRDKAQWVRGEAAKMMLRSPRLTEDAAMQAASDKWETLGMPEMGYAEEPDEESTFKKLRTIIVEEGNPDTVIVIDNEGSIRVVTRDTDEWARINSKIIDVTDGTAREMTIEDYILDTDVKFRPTGTTPFDAN